MNKNEIISAFCKGAKSGKASNLEIVGNKLYNYSTVIGVRSASRIYINNTKYSSTTSKNQGYLRRYAGAGAVELSAKEMAKKFDVSTTAYFY